jgi:hypothetical protein
VRAAVAPEADAVVIPAEIASRITGRRSGHEFGGVSLAKRRLKDMTCRSVDPCFFAAGAGDASTASAARTSIAARMNLDMQPPGTCRMGMSARELRRPRQARCISFVIARE